MSAPWLAFVLVSILVPLCALGLWIGRRRTQGRFRTPQPRSESAAFIIEDPASPRQGIEVVFTTESQIPASEVAESATDDRPHTTTDLILAELIRAIPNATALLDRGFYMRAIGPANLVAEVRNGTLSLVSSAGQDLGTVTDGKKFVGQLRFARSTSPVRVAAPLVAFQIASLVTAQYYLHRITKQLDEIIERVQQVRYEKRIDVHGTIEAMAAQVRRLSNALREHGTLSEHDRQRLLHVEHEVEMIYFQLRKQLKDFFANANEEIRSLDQIDKERMASLLADAAGIRVYEARLFLLVVAVRNQVHKLDAVVEMQSSPERWNSARSRAEEERSRMLEEWEALRMELDALCVSQTKVQERWWFSGAVEKAIGHYVSASSSLRSVSPEVLRTSVLSLESQAPFVIEARRAENGSVETRSVLMITASEDST